MLVSETCLLRGVPHTHVLKLGAGTLMSLRRTHQVDRYVSFHGGVMEFILANSLCSLSRRLGPSQVSRQVNLYSLFLLSV